MLLPKALMLAMFPASAPYLSYLQDAGVANDINTPIRLAKWIAQTAVESKNFEAVRESLNYKVSTLIPTFGKHRITEAQAKALGRVELSNGRVTQIANQAAIADTVYGGAWGMARLGNTQPGDGYRFRGRGLIQVTGRYNYGQISHIMYGEDILLHDPAILETPRGAAHSAGAFWSWKKLNEIADNGTVEQLSYRVNGTDPAHGLAERIRITSILKAVLEKLPPDFDNVLSGSSSTERDA